MSDLGQPQRVIVVLDDAHTRLTIRTTLERAGFDVEFIPDAEEALASFRRERPAVVVVGSKLAKMDGFVFLYRLKGDGLDRCIPTLMIAEEREKNRAKLAMSRGAHAFMVKPLMVRKLLERVTALANGDAQERDAVYAAQILKLEQGGGAPSSSPSSPGDGTVDPIRVERTLVKRVRRSKAEVVKKRSNPRQDLVQKLRIEAKRLKALPYHERLDLGLQPEAETVATAFRRIAMQYHPDRYKHHGKDARRAAQVIFMLLSEAKKSLRPEAPPAPIDSPRSSDSWKDTAAVRDTPRAERWTPAAIDLDAISSSGQQAGLMASWPDDSEPGLPVAPSENATDSVPEVPTAEASNEPPAAATESRPGAAVVSVDDEPLSSRTTTKADARESGERVAPDPIAAKRAAALEALSQGRYRDAKNQLAKLLDELGEEAEETELRLAEKLARGHLAWSEGQLDDAVEMFESAFELDPECPEAIAAIAGIQAAKAKKSGLFNRLLGKK